MKKEIYHELLKKGISNIGSITLYDNELKQLYKALLSCLTPEEKMNIFLELISSSAFKRNIVLESIKDDLNNNILNNYQHLIYKLMIEFDRVDYNTKKSLSYSILTLLSHFKEKENEVLNFLLSKGYKSINRQVYNYIEQNDLQSEYIDIVLEIWHENPDVSSAVFIVKHSKLDILINNFDDLENILSDYYKRLLYLRVAKFKDDILVRLKKKDEISYLYISTKIGIKNKPEEFVLAYKKAREINLEGLIFWCAGQQKNEEGLVALLREKGILGK